MSADEIRVRTSAILTQQRERRSYRRAKAHPSGNGHIVGLLSCDLSASAARVVPGTQPGELEKLQHTFPELHARMKTRCENRAAAVVSGSWKLLGHPVDLRDGVDWHRDPRSDFSWPKCFYTEIPLDELSGKVDYKYVWELGRQQYVVELARGWRMSHHARFANDARRLILDWIEQNPLYEGVHWTSALEVAMRAISWLWVLAGLSEWNGWHADDRPRIASSLCEHAAYLENHLSFYTSPYNHLIGEATALLLIGEVLNSNRDAAHWLQRGADVLAEHAPRQFYADGFSVEQATGYHFFTLGFLLQAVAAARRGDVTIDGLEEVVHRAFRAAMAMRQPNGRWPAIGDFDSARSMPVYPDDPWNFDGVCSLAAVLFDDPQLKPPGSQPGEELCWILGCDGIEHWQQLDSGSATTCTVLEDSGYAIARSKNDWLLFDAGPIAEGLHSDATPSTAHGHADALQVLYFADGKELLIDSGMPFYQGPRRWIDHFRGPAAHNTLEVEGAAMAHSAGPLDWSHVRRRPSLDANLSEEAWLVRGRANWNPGVVVERYVLGIPECGLWIADWVKTDQPRRVRWYWQIPRTGVAIINGNAELSEQSNELVLATWSVGAPLSGTVPSGSLDSPAAWHAPRYGILQTARRIIRECQPATNILVATYVGRSFRPFEVIVHSTRIRCGTPASPDCHGCHVQSSIDKSCHADVAWRIETPTGPLEFHAGYQVDSLPVGVTRLTGIGAWSAAWSTASSISNG